MVLIIKFYVLLFLLLPLSSARAQNPPAAVVQELQNILDQSLPNETNPGVVMGIHVPGQWSWYGASGNAISGNTSGYPATNAMPSDHFRAGSITKMFGAVSLLQLEEQGLLSLEDSISKYLRPSLLTDTIPNGLQLTIKMLLNHTSGVADLATNDSCQQDALGNLNTPYSLEQAAYCGGSQGANFIPGTGWGYSNTNYTLIAMLIEEISGMAFEDYIYHNIISPLGLLSTETPANPEITASHMGCYWWVLPNIMMVDLTVVNASMYSGWANLVSSTEDLINFYKALKNGSLVNSVSLSKMFNAEFPSTWYGLGTELLALSGSEYYGHSGEVGNTSGLYYCNISTSACPNGYYISYNFNYQGVDFSSKIDVPVFNYLTSLQTTMAAEKANDISVGVFPNPSNGVFHIEIMGSENVWYDLGIKSIAGLSVLHAKNIKSSFYTVDLSRIPRGVYTYELVTNSQTKIGKIILR